MKRGFLDVTNNNGPLYLSTREGVRFAAGGFVNYEKGNNGVRVGLAAFPYRVDLLYKNFPSGFINPSTISLWSVLYNRRIFNVPAHHFSLYLLAGVGIGRYAYSRVYKAAGTGGSVAINGQVIYTDDSNFFTLYDRRFVVLPMVKAEVERGLFGRVSLSANISYTFRNMLFHRIPLESGTYAYTYYGQKRAGEIANYGSGYQIGLNLKYRIDLHPKKTPPYY